MPKQKQVSIKHQNTTSKLIEDKVNNIIIAKPWEKIDKFKHDPVKHTGQKYLKFLNTEVFSESSKYYLKRGYYTNAPEGTSEYIEFWDEEERRCKEGYTVGGVSITGDHYAYLNFYPILKVDLKNTFKSFKQLFI